MQLLLECVSYVHELTHKRYVSYFHTPLRISHFVLYVARQPVAVAVRAKAWVCGRSLAGIAGLNPAADMVFSLL